MTIRFLPDDVIQLEGVCPIEDAEVLLQHLVAHPASAVDWRNCVTAHTAIVQLMMAAKPVLIGPPAGEFLRMWVAPMLAAGSGQLSDSERRQ